VNLPTAAFYIIPSVLMIVYFTEFTEKYSSATATKIGIIGVTFSHALRLLVYFNYWFYAAGIITCAIF